MEVLQPNGLILNDLIDEEPTLNEQAHKVHHLHHIFIIHTDLQPKRQTVAEGEKRKLNVVRHSSCRKLPVNDVPEHFLVLNVSFSHFHYSLNQICQFIIAEIGFTNRLDRVFLKLFP